MPLALARNRRRSLVTLSPRYELVIGAFGDVVPGTHEGAWNFVNDACTVPAIGVFSDCSLTTSAASFLRSRSTATGSWRIST